ncbi:MAG: ATP-binding protein [Anaerolineales bacterium]|nr:ATP-binding protein [Anaerolineales bacterium]
MSKRMEQYGHATLNIDDLINARSVESIRIEYKASWNEATRPSIIKSIAAFANDLYNLDGGFIILGIEAPDGSPVLPPIGLSKQSLEKIQQEIRVACKKIDPEYQPLIIPAEYMEKMIMILCIPASDNRPHLAPDDRREGERCYYVRQGAESVKAADDTLRQLIEQTARTPFDDRRNSEATVLDLSPILVKRFLQEVNSDILNSHSAPADVDIYKSLRIVASWNDKLLPKNVGLLFFNERPRRFLLEQLLK